MIPTTESPQTEEALVERARQGGRAAFVALVARHQQRVYRLALRMTHNRSDAEDITQETFLRALRGIASFQGDSKLGTWLYRIAMNEVLMRQRASRRRPMRSLEVVMPHFTDLGAAADAGGDASHRADDLVHDKTLALRVRDALASLDADQRAAVVLRDLEELSAEEAAGILGVTPDTIRQRAHRARLKLREQLRSLDGDAPFHYPKSPCASRGAP